MKKNTDKIRENKHNDWKFYVVLFSVAALIIILRATCFIVTKCDGNSMYPTIRSRATLVGTKIYMDINRNDLVIAKPEGMEKTVIKRVVGIGGDHIEIKDGKLYINGKEDTMFPDTYYADETFDITVADDCYFLMGDNREHSEDSRVFGTIDEDNIEYKVIYYSKEKTSP